MARTLIIIGTIVIIVGLLWPWLQKLGFGRLPGDILIERGNTRFYFPLMTSIIVSVVISLLLWFFRK